MQKYSKLLSAPFSHPNGATENDARKLHAQSFCHSLWGILAHEVLCLWEGTRKTAALQCNEATGMAQKKAFPNVNRMAIITCNVLKSIEVHPNLTIAENLFFNDLPKQKIINWNKLYQDAKEVLEKFGMGEFDPRAKMSFLTRGQQQMLLIVKALIRADGGAKVLILDEPTASLTESEIKILFEYLQDVKAIDRFTNVVKRHPNMKTVLCHIGVCNLWDQKQAYPYPDLQKVLKLFDINKDHLYMDTSAMSHFDNEYPFPRSQNIFKTVYDAIGTDRLMWGSDFPTLMTEITYEQSLTMFTRHIDYFRDSDWENFLYKNAQKVYFD